MYKIHTTLIPKRVCYRIEQLVRKFIWGGGKKERSCSLVKGDVIVNPKDYGGLDIRKMDQMNLAFISKLGWRVLTKHDQLWACLLVGKYMHRKASLDLFKPK